MKHTFSSDLFKLFFHTDLSRFSFLFDDILHSIDLFLYKSFHHSFFTFYHQVFCSLTFSLKQNIFYFHVPIYSYFSPSSVISIPNIPFTEVPLNISRLLYLHQSQTHSIFTYLPSSDLGIIYVSIQTSIRYSSDISIDILYYLVFTTRAIHQFFNLLFSLCRRN